MKKRFLSFISAIVLLLTIIPFSAFAAVDYGIEVSQNENKITVTGIATNGQLNLGAQDVTLKMVDRYSRDILIDQNKTNSDGSYTFGPYNLANGDYTVTVGGFGAPQSKAIKVDGSVTLSDNARLGELSISTGYLLFNPNIFKYDLTVGTDITQMTVTPYTADPKSRLLVEGQPQQRGATSRLSINSKKSPFLIIFLNFLIYSSLHSKCTVKLRYILCLE